MKVHQVSRFITLSVLKCLLLLAVFTGSRGEGFGQRILYVDLNAAGLNDGSSWADAFTDLHLALDSAVSGDSIWMASGTYFPDTANRDTSFVLKDSVGIFGGFSGVETSFSQRNVHGNLTIVSGEIGNPNSLSDNIKTLFWADSVKALELNGLFLEKAVADSIHRCGGFFAAHSSGFIRNCTFRNLRGVEGGGFYFSFCSQVEIDSCQFEKNRAVNGGGGYLNYSKVIIRNSQFKQDSADNNGGAIHSSSVSSFRAENCSVRDCFSQVNGGGFMFKHTYVTLERDTICENSSIQGGGGIYFEDSLAIISKSIIDTNISGDGGGLRVLRGNMSIINSNFRGNGDTTISAAGGGISIYQSSDLTLVRSVIAYNIANNSGGGIYVTNSKFRADNSDFYHNRVHLGSGGGITINSSSQNYFFGGCNFWGNSAGEEGGGMNIINSNGTIEACTFKQNIADSLIVASKGGAIYRLSGTVKIRRSTFEKNLATYGGAISLESSGLDSIENSVFFNNEAYLEGAGIRSSSRHSFIDFCTFNRNHAGSSGGAIQSSDTLLLRNSIFWDDSASGGPNELVGVLNPNYCNIRGNPYGGSNFNFDPKFASPDTSNLALDCQSPVMNLGVDQDVPISDILGNTRRYGGSPDLGAFENNSGPGFSSLEIVGPNKICSQGSIQVKVLINGGQAPFNFQINGGNYMSSQTTDTLSVGIMANQDTPLLLDSVQDFNGCFSGQISSRDTVFVTEGPTAASVLAPPQICDGDSLFLQIKVNGGTGPYNFRLNADSFFDFDTNGVVKLFPSRSRNYRLRWLSDSAGCFVPDVALVSAFVDLEPIPDAGFSGYRDVCENEGPILLVPNHPQYKNRFDMVGNALGVSGEYFLPTIADTGIKGIIHVATDSLTGCEGRDTADIRVHALPDISFSIGVDSIGADSILYPKVKFCANDSIVNLYGFPPGGTFSGPGVVDSIGTQTFNPGAFLHNTEIVYTYTDSNSCTSSVTEDVFVNLVTQANFGIDNNYSKPLQVCVGDTLPLIFSPSGGMFYIHYSNSKDSIRVNTGTYDFSTDSVMSITLEYVYSNSVGCTDVTSFRLTVLDSPNVSIDTIFGHFCRDGQPAVLTGSPTGGIFGFFDSSGNVLNGPGINDRNPGEFIPDSLGTDTVRVEYTLVDNYGCEGTDEKFIYISQLPVISLSINKNIFCFNSPPELITALPSGGNLFSDSGAVVGINNYYYPGLVGSGFDKIIYYYMDNTTKCFDSDTLEVQVNKPVPVSFDINRQVCVGDDTLSLTKYLSSGGRNIPIGDFYGIGIIDSKQGIFDPDSVSILNLLVRNPIPIEFHYYDTSSTCDVVLLDTLWLNPLPQVSLIGLDSSYCVDEPNVQLSGIPNVSSLLVDTSFFKLDGDPLPGGDFYPSRAGVGMHVVSYEVINVYGCSTIEAHQVRVDSLPDIELRGLDSFYCANDGVDLLNAMPVGGVYFGSGVQITDEEFYPGRAIPGFVYVSYTYTDTITGCRDTVTQRTRIYPQPGVVFGRLPAVCINDNLQQLEQSFVTPIGGYFQGSGIVSDTIPGRKGIDSTYSFDPNLILGSNFLGDSSFSLVYHYVDSNGCRNRDSSSVLVNGLPAVDFSGLTSGYCAGSDTAVLTGFPAGGYFRLDTAGNDSAVPNAAGFAGLVLNLSPLTPLDSQYVVSYFFTDQNGCKDDTSRKFWIHPNPKADFRVGNFCSQHPIQFTDHSSILSPPGKPQPDHLDQWYWSTGTGDSLGAQQNLSHSFTGGGKVDVKLIVTSDKNCSSDTTISFQLSEAPKACFDWQYGCFGDAMLFRDLSGFTNPAIRDTLDSISYDFGDGYQFKLPAGDSITHIYASPGYYLVRLDVSTRKGCRNTFTDSVLVKPLINSFPYLEPFDHARAPLGYVTGGVKSSWAYTFPSGNRIAGSFDNTRCWVTGDSSNYNLGEQSYVEFPCIDLRSLDKPMISLFYTSNLQKLNSQEDAVILEYSADSGRTWHTFGEYDYGINWYNDPKTTYGRLGPGWVGDQSWREGRFRLDSIASYSQLLMRIRLAANTSLPTEGFAFDRVYIGKRRRTGIIEILGGPRENIVLTALNQLLRQNGLDAEVQVVVNAGEPDSLNNPFYWSYSSGPLTRQNYYSIANWKSYLFSGIPINIHDTSNNQLNEEAVLKAIDRMILDDSTFQITLDSFRVHNGVYEVNAVVRYLGPLDTLFKNCIVMIGIIDAKGQAGSWNYEWVNRIYLPDAVGALNNGVWVKGQDFVISETGNVQGRPIHRNSAGVAVWIQEKNHPREVYQAAFRWLDSRVTAVSPPASGGNSNELSVFPNPAGDAFQVVSSEGVPIQDLQVSDMWGRIILSHSPGVSSVRLSAANLADGIYVVSAKIGSKWFRKRLRIIH